MLPSPLVRPDPASPLPEPQPPLLQVADLHLGFTRPRGRLLSVVQSANLTVAPNQAVGIVGESGSGKTMLCRALLGTLGRRGGVIVAGRIVFAGRDLAQAPERVWRQVRGREIGYVPQSSLAGLNPVLTVETQLKEAILAARPVSPAQARREALELLERVRIPRAARVLQQRAAHLSGGMRQRVMIAAAIAQRPKLLVADEPTTALDVTIQREILTLIQSLRQELGMGLVLVSHDLAVIEEVCDSLMVLYAGATVEVGSVAALSATPLHPYTRALRLSRVDVARPGADLEAIPGEAVSVGNWPGGCRFGPRCPLVGPDCQQGIQPPLAWLDQRATACLHWQQLPGAGQAEGDPLR